MVTSYCNCRIPANLQQDQMTKAIMAYVNGIDPELRTDDAEYERRLKLCSGCRNLIGGLTCGHCGCFVLARARKQDNICPAPEGNLWNKI